MLLKSKSLFLLIVLCLQGCPVEDNECNKVMQCEEDVELLCDKTDAGCGEVCHYHVYELCYEVCKDEK